jgi:hypothetical protein
MTEQYKGFERTPVEDPFRNLTRFSLKGLMIAVFVAGVIAVVFFLLVVPGIRSRRAGEECVANLRRIAIAKDQLQLNSPGVPEWSNMIHYDNGLTNLCCPLAEGTNRTFDNSYGINLLGSPPTCKICPNDHRLPRY